MLRFLMFIETVEPNFANIIPIKTTHPQLLWGIHKEDYVSDPSVEAKYF
jgi:hypothetical protein